jgi:ubiquinone/menaquinone biosynthesis C-methylase UbiE
VGTLDEALQEIQRVLRAGGRLVIFATNWSSLVWHSTQPERMQRVLTAFAAHAPYPDLPAILGARLRQGGLHPMRQTPVPILNTSYNANRLSYWTARLVVPFVQSRQAIPADEAAAWFQEFETLEGQGAYFFCVTPILTEAVKRG